ncbi:hypothetical protein GKQ38_04855 [Candidatus Nanohaloarchaea archaeon]|nr:hypothetical protein GKQ38_04855 [Candidatus Nanohaloarchaea archaeon]
MRKYLALLGTLVFLLLSIPAATASTVTWSDSSDWNNAVSDFGVVHESVTNTDHNDAGKLQKGYPIQNPVVSYGLVGYWPLQEDSGDTAYDFSGYNDASASAPTQGSSGILGSSSYYFNTESADASTIDLEYYSFNAWINDEGSTYYARAMSNGRDGTDPSATYAMGSRNGWPTAVMRKNGNTYTIGSGLNPSDWTMVTVTYDGDTLKVYTDGSLTGSSTAPSGPIGDVTGPFNLGSTERYPGNEGITGYLQEASLYNRALSASEIQSLYEVAATPGTLTTGWKTFSSNRDMNSLQLENVQASLNGGSITVYVETQNGEVSDPISLDGSGGPYSVTGLSTEEDQFRLDIRLDNSDVTSTPTLSAIDLTGNKANSPPAAPSNEDPADNADPVSLSPSLSVFVDDPDGDSMDVTFYVDTNNDGSYETTKTNTGVASGSTTSVSLSSLATSQTVNWYVVADDGRATTQSSTWSFTTVGVPSITSAPSPSDGAVDVSTSKNLAIDVSHPDNLDMTVEFSMDGSYVGSDTVAGSGTASYSPSLGYSEDHSWSVDVYTQGYSTQTSGGAWNFHTVHDVSASLSGPSKSPASIDPTLSATVSHSDSAETVTVDFVNTDNGNTICSVSGIGNAETATCDTSGSSFGSSPGTTYNWEVQLSGDEGSESWTSSQRSFTTISNPNVNRVEPGSNSGVSTDQNLVVDVSHPDGKNMNVEFMIRKAGQTSFSTVDTKTDVSGQVSANPSLSDGTSYEWRVDVRTVGYSTDTMSSIWGFTTNYVPSVSGITKYDASDGHAFRNVSAIISDQDGDDTIVDANLTVDNDGGLETYVEYDEVSIDRSYGGDDNQANVTFGRVNVGDSNWGLTGIDLQVEGIDQEGNVGSNTLSNVQFPNHAPTVASGYSYSDSPQAHSYTLSIDAQDVDDTDEEIASCTVDHNDGDGNSYTGKAGSLASGETATCSFTIDNSTSGYRFGEMINHRVTFKDAHGKTVTSTWASHRIPNSLPSATNLRPASDNTSYDADLKATYNDPDGDVGNLTFYNTTSGEELGAVADLAPGEQGTVDLVGELAPGTTYNFTVEASDGVNSTNSTENFTTIYRPDEPYDPFPENDTVIDTTTRSGDDIAASVKVVQDDGHTMNVQFINASDDSPLGTDYDVESGTRAKLTSIGNTLRDETNTTYRWYAVATDQTTGESVRSDTFVFRTPEVGEVRFDVMQGRNENMDITGNSDNGYRKIKFEVTSTEMDPIPTVIVNETGTGNMIKSWSNVANNSVLTIDLVQDGSQDWNLDTDEKYEWTVEARDGSNILGNRSYDIYTYNVTLDWDRAEKYYNVYQYDIYRAEQRSGVDLTFNYGNGDYNLVGSLPETSFNDSGPGIVPDHTGTFCWKVAASNPTGSSPAIPSGEGNCKTLN